MDELGKMVLAITNVYRVGAGLDPIGNPDPEDGACIECGYVTSDRHDDEWLCDECNAELVRGQAEDHRLDDPRHGQAAYINRGR